MSSMNAEEVCVDCEAPAASAQPAEGGKREDLMDASTFHPPLDLAEGGLGMPMPLVVIEVSRPLPFSTLLIFVAESGTLSKWWIGGV